MYTALVSAETAATSGFSIANLVILIALVIVAVPLFQRLRKSASKNRKRRWVEEGLMDPPADGPEAEKHDAEKHDADKG